MSTFLASLFTRRIPVLSYIAARTFTDAQIKNARDTGIGLPLAPAPRRGEIILVTGLSIFSQCVTQYGTTPDAWITYTPGFFDDGVGYHLVGSTWTGSTGKWYVVTGFTFSGMNNNLLDADEVSDDPLNVDGQNIRGKGLFFWVGNNAAFTLGSSQNRITPIVEYKILPRGVLPL